MIARVFLRYPGHNLDADTRKAVVAVWGPELMQWFGEEEASDVMRWAEATCRGFASPFLPALDPLVEGMLDERARTTKVALLRLEAPQEEEHPLSREEAKRVLADIQARLKEMH